MVNRLFFLIFACTVHIKKYQKNSRTLLEFSIIIGGNAFFHYYSSHMTLIETLVERNKHNGKMCQYQFTWTKSTNLPF